MNALKSSILLLTVACCSAFAFYPSETNSKTGFYVSAPSNASLKAKALIVLQNKCNVCHLEENKSVIFTELTMMHKARKIHKMVFVKKKMPKDDVVLTAQESKDLRLWLNSLGY